MEFRCSVYGFGGVLAIVTALITACDGQCSSRTAVPRPLQLNADSSLRSFRWPRHGYGSYPPNSNCAWRIKAEYGHVVRLMVNEMELLTGPNGCPYDSVSIYDGYSPDSHRLAKICARTYSYRFYYSSGRYMYVNFISDNSKDYGWFRMEYMSVSESPTTTRRPHWVRTTPSMTTTTSDYRWTYHLNSAAIFGGLIGACMFLFVLLALCRYCCNRSASRPSPHFTTPTSGTGHAHQSNSVYTIPGSGCSPSASNMGNTNMGFSLYAEPPPSYDSLHCDTSFVQLGNGAPPTEPQAPPSYAEATTGINTPSAPKPEQID